MNNGTAPKGLWEVSITLPDGLRLRASSPHEEHIVDVLESIVHAYAAPGSPGLEECVRDAARALRRMEGEG